MLLSYAIKIINIFYGSWVCSAFILILILLSSRKWSITFNRKKFRDFIKNTSDTKK